MSLIGKPLIYKNHRTDQRFRRTQSQIHNFLERPRGWKAASYHLSMYNFYLFFEYYYFINFFMNKFIK